MVAQTLALRSNTPSAVPQNVSPLHDANIVGRTTVNGMRAIPSPQQSSCAAELRKVNLPVDPESVLADVPRVVHGESRLELFYNILSYREPTYVFIDGANFKAGCDKLNIEFDYRRFWNFMFRMSKLTNIKYYAAMTERDNDKFVRWLTANGFQTFIKPIREDGSAQVRPDTLRLRKNIDAELSADMAVLPYMQPDVKHVILLSGDGDFCHTIKLMQDRGVRVSVISPDLSVGITSRDLIKAADFFVPLEILIQENNLGRSILVNGRKVIA